MSKRESLRDKLLKATTNKDAARLDKSVMFNTVDMTMTNIPILNIALSGEVQGGLASGITVVAGPSKHFKTSIALKKIKAYLDKHADAIAVFFDIEFGTPADYVRSAGIDPERVIHIPCANVEELKFYMFEQLEAITRGDRVIFMIDSIGNVASKKEIDDAKDHKSVADMTRAKALKSLFRIITPYFRLKNVPGVVINHTIETMEMFSKTVMTGGTGVQYSCDTAIIISRRQIGSSKELEGYEFVLNIDKSRFVKEKSKFFLSVTFDGGIKQYSGLYEIAEELGYIVKPSVGWYSRSFLNESTGEMLTEDKKWRKADMDTGVFWKDLLTHTPFLEAIKAKYKLGAIVTDETVEEEVDEILGLISDPKKLAKYKNMTMDQLISEADKLEEGGVNVTKG